VFPKDIADILQRLYDKGIKAYVVGGAVRDILMGRSPEDYDVAAECFPEELVAAFADCESYDTGIRFGTLCVHSGERFVEITCCRTEEGYSDRRRPDEVRFCKSIEKDLARRDLTVNAMAMTATGEVIDPFFGRQDLHSGIIRCVGEPERRFSEDGLRIIRALRFASCLGFEIEEKTRTAILSCRELLLKVSGERIFTELKKLLMGENVLRVLLEYSDVICTVIPELSASVGFEQNNPHHIYTVYEHTARAVAASPANINVRLCMLLHDIAKPSSYTVDEKGIGHFYGHPERSERMAGDILRRMRADGETVRAVCFLVKYHDVRPAASRKSLHKYISKVGFDGARTLLDVRRADLSAQSPEYFSQFEYLDESERIINELEAEGACTGVSELAVNGRDLIELGIPEGKAVGEALSQLLKEVIAGNVKNERNALLKLTKKKMKISDV